MRVELNKLVTLVDGRLVEDNRPPDPEVISGVSTDSRNVKPGDVFFALTGDNFDGHEFVPTAIKGGAQAIVVHTVPAEAPGVAVVQVDDPLAALGKLAAWWRSEQKAPVVAVVGSSGKTTTKEMAGEILTRFFETLTTKANLNNLIGLPQTLFGMQASHEAVVLELGMNLPDENRQLMEIAQPDCVVLTNINHAHIGMFESPRAHYEAEAEPVRYASPGAMLIINKDDPLSVQAVEEYAADRKIIWYSTSGPADFYAEDVTAVRPYGYEFTLRNAHGDSAEVSLKLFGRHNVANAVAAAAVAAFYHISLEDAAEQLSMFRPRYNRSEVDEIDGYYIVKDYYNAIPAAVVSALNSLDDFDISGRRFAVLGDMMELGDHERHFHELVAEAAASAGLTRLYTIGERGRIIHDRAEALGLDSSHYDDVAPMAADLRQELRRGDLLLIKGSRAIRLERLYDLLKQHPVAAR
jgi:UDP-N-acetylmuramoyl-tripeptide--D-alanyl-D-alanine ligase